MADQILRGILSGPNGAARVVALIATDTCAEVAARHQASPAAAVALARATSAALLCATLTKGDERVTVQVLGDGPLGAVTACASDAGEARAFVSSPQVGAGPLVEGRATLGSLVGGGLVNVVRDLGLKDRYQGSTALVSGEIDEDVEAYLTGSEQVESALCADAVVDDAGRVISAGGLLVQCLPGGDLEAVEAARGVLRGGALYRALRAGATAPAALARHLLGVDPDVLDVRPVSFRCPCNRERVAAALALCGAAELRDMLERDRGAEVSCNFCSERYVVDATELERLIESLAQA